MTVLEILKEKTAEEIADMASSGGKFNKLFNMDLFTSYYDKCSAINCPNLIHGDYEDAWMEGLCSEEFYGETCPYGICRKQMVKQDLIEYLNNEY